MNPDDTGLPHPFTHEWAEQHWHCQRATGGHGDPATAVYYGFLAPTHVVIFLDPYTDLSRLTLQQVRPAPDQRPGPFRLPDPLPAGWIGPGHPAHVPLVLNTSQWVRERHCRRLATHPEHKYTPRGHTEIHRCPGIAHDHDARCCTEHGTHTTPHKGCVLR